ncbi:hypothetical protein [Siphonobacter curvatus]|uniref:Phage portal protein n=1 Tax=Siphonobacter curvatus TaxID=2094562 RepID=A0A2S7IN33_9BACT|nr:hypothetical protein [Siphonobacter curvatus]PQA59153.1 hypothetical protein C5O19_05720 [Siphonobacter curvatus]
MYQFSENLYMVEARGGGAMVELTGRRDASFGVGSIFQATNDSLPHVRWGVADNQPNTISRVIQKNNQVRGQLDSLRDMIYGSGLGFFKKQITENGKLDMVPFTDNRLEDWMEETNLQGFCIASINQFVQNANRFTRMIWNPIREYYELEVSDCFVTRIGKPDKYGVFEYHTNPYFGEGMFINHKETQKIQAFDARQSVQAATVTMHHSKADIPGNPFYAYPSWWCALDWIELANLIPLFHKSGLKNGYNIKYLIRMPKDYFDKDGDRDLDQKKVRQRWDAFGVNLSKWMSGTDNVNKSMLIKYMRGQDGKMLDNIDVIPLKNEMSDDAYSKVWEMSNVSIANSMGILPTLAGVNPGKGNDSGSQIRVMADYQQHYRTPVPRQLMLEPIRHSLRAMGYRDVVPAFKDVLITNLDENPNGKKATVNPAA